MDVVPFESVSGGATNQSIELIQQVKQSEHHWNPMGCALAKTIDFDYDSSSSCCCALVAASLKLTDHWMILEHISIRISLSKKVLN